jgi:hypothetical protein
MRMKFFPSAYRRSLCRGQLSRICGQRHGSTALFSPGRHRLTSRSMRATVSTHCNSAGASASDSACTMSLCDGSDGKSLLYVTPMLFVCKRINIPANRYTRLRSTVSYCAIAATTFARMPPAQQTSRSMRRTHGLLIAASTRHCRQGVGARECWLVYGVSSGAP